MTTAKSLTVLWLAAGSLLAQISSVEGYVKDAAGKPVPNAAIQILRQDVHRSYQAKTDKRGSYFYQGLPLGFYAIKVLIDGREVAGVDGIRTQPDAPLEISFDLGATPQEQEARIKSSLKNLGAEWSYVKILTVQQTSPAPAAAPQPATPRSVAVPQAKQQAKQPVPVSTAPPAAAEPTESAGTHYVNALALAKAGKWEEMRAEIKQAADLDPSNAYRAYYNLGTVLSNAGEQELAAEAFRLAVAAAPDDPRNAESYYQSALALVSQAKVGADGKTIAAPGTVAALQKYLRLAPNGPNAPAARELLANMGEGKK